VSPLRPSRKQARRDALFVLYQREVTGEPIEVLLAKLRDREGYEPDPFTVHAATGVSLQADELDETLQHYSRDWALSRMAAIERSALRLGLFELQLGATPPEVVVDEAVRLVRRYASDEGGGLVNGILGAVLREMQRDGRAWSAPAGAVEVPEEPDEAYEEREDEDWGDDDAEER
jgi:transcription antitermination protein NusB